MRSRLMGVGMVALCVTAGCGRDFTAPTVYSPATPLSAFADATQVAPLGTTRVHARGGSGTYLFSLADGGAGAIDPTGLYTAGATGDVTDVVLVGDVATGATHDSTQVPIRVGPAVALAPAAATTAPGGILNFVAQGGEPPYTFAMAPRGNSSFGSISSTGVYVAGNNPNQTDLVQVVDANGAIITAPVEVGNAQIPLQTFGTTALHPGDFNGDGEADLLINSGNVIEVLLTTPRSPVVSQLIELPCTPYEIAILDANGDGLSDVIGLCGGKIFLLLASYGGQLLSPPGWPWAPPAALLGNWGGQYAVLHVPDGDAGTDLLAVSGADLSNPLAPAVQVLVVGYGDGGGFNTSGEHEPVQLFGVDEVSLAPLGGSLGLIAAVGGQLKSSGNSLAMVSLGEVNGAFGESVIMNLAGFQFGAGGVLPTGTAVGPTTDCPASYYSASFVDIDGDGQQDFFSVSNADGGEMLCVDQGNPDGTFASAQFSSLPADTSTITTVMPPDATHGGERVLFATTAGGLIVSEQGGTLAAEAAIIPTAQLGLASADFNGDHLDDLVGLDARSNLVFVPADARGHFSSGLRLQVTSSATPLSRTTPDGQALIYGTDDGTLVLEPSTTQRLSLASQVFQGQGAPQALFGDARGTWLQPSLLVSSSTALVTRTDAGWVGTVVPQPAAWTLMGAAGATGAFAGSVLLFEDGNTHLNVETVDLEGNTTSALINPHDTSPAALVSLAPGLDALLTEPSNVGTAYLYLPLTDGGLNWQSTPTDTFDATRIGPTYSNLTFEYGLALTTAGAPDHVLFMASSSTDNAYHSFVYSPATQAFTEVCRSVAAVADLNGDGLNDFLCIDAFPSDGGVNTYALVQQSDGTFPSTTVTIAASLVGKNAAFIDLDGDGLPDLVETDAASGRMDLWYNRSVSGGPIVFQ